MDTEEQNDDTVDTMEEETTKNEQNGDKEKEKVVTNDDKSRNLDDIREMMKHLISWGSHS